MCSVDLEIIQSNFSYHSTRYMLQIIRRSSVSFTDSTFYIVRYMTRTFTMGYVLSSNGCNTDLSRTMIADQGDV